MDKPKKPKSIIPRSKPEKGWREPSEVKAAYDQIGHSARRDTKSWYRDIYEFYQNNEC